MATKFLNTIKFPGLDDTYVVNDLSIIAPDYDDTKEYKIGNLLTYLGKQYYCIADAPAGTLPTNTTYFEEQSVAGIIEMIKQGTIITGHSQVADNLTPYSEDSGTTQDNPFISQGTGTDNNSVIVTTGAIARQLEKQGNTVPVMQLIPSSFVMSANAGITITENSGVYTIANSGSGLTGGYLGSQYFYAQENHSYLFRAKVTTTEAVNVRVGIYEYSPTVSVNGTQYVASVQKRVTGTSGGSYILFQCAVEGGKSADFSEFVAFDITGWKASDIADITSHPEHFSWYYNGSLAYDEGSLQNCNGRYLECGQGRNLLDDMEVGYINPSTGAEQSANDALRSGYKIVVPNKPIHIYAPNNSTSQKRIYVIFYDFNKTYIDGKSLDNWTVGNGYGTGIVTAPSNATFVRITTANVSSPVVFNHDIDLELYYTPAEGGEGYDAYYPYVAPIRIDTGNETLYGVDGSRDVKLPSGLITRVRKRYTLSKTTMYWNSLTISGATVYYTSSIQDLKDFSTKTVTSKGLTPTTYNSIGNVDNSIAIWSGGGTHFTGFRVDSITSLDAFKDWIDGAVIEAELAESTTEQGTPYSEYADINDYSYMAWFDTDGNLVSIPQGCKLFYPVDYKGFVDDLVMYTNGDATALAKEEDIADEALNARGYYKLQDLSSEIADVTGVTYLGKKAYKIGNLVNLTIVARNDSGAEMASLVINLGTSLKAVATTNDTCIVDTTPVRLYINSSGSGGYLGVNSAIGNGKSVFINVTYAGA